MRIRVLYPIIVTVILGLMLIAPGDMIAHAQTNAEPDGLRVWVNEGRRMRLVGVDSVLADFKLPLSGDAVRVDSAVAVTSDDTFFAYLGNNDAGDAPRFFIYDRPRDQLVASYAPQGMIYAALGIHASDQIYETGAERRIALGYALDTGGWEIAVIDLETFGISAALRNGTPNTSELPASYGLIPVPLDFRADGKIGFALVQGGTEGSPSYPAFLWDTVTGEVVADAGYINTDLDILEATGEVVLPLADSRFPDQADLFPFWQNNTLQIYNPATGERFPFYHEQFLNLGSPKFVNGGRQVMTWTAFPDGRRLSFVNRNGEFAWMFTDMQIARVTAGTAGGFVALMTADNTMMLVYVDMPDTMNAESDPDQWPQTIMWSDVWDGGNVSLAGIRHAPDVTPPLPDPVNLTDFVALAPSVEPEAPDIVIETPDVITVGQLATVRTTEGDRLNMRTGAGVDFAIVERLDRGTVVTVIDGPVNANGYTWWKLRTSSGREGWAVEFAENEQTLVAGTSPVTGGGAIDETEAGGSDASVESRLEVGDEIEVTLTQGSDGLRLRNGAGLDFRVITLLSDGTPLTVIGGPVEVDNFIWWEVRTPEGNTGFAAEIIGRERVLTALDDVQATSTTLTPPTLMEPVNGATVRGLSQNVVFTWSSINGATQYDFTLFFCPDECVIAQDIDTPFTSVTVPISEAGDYRWQVATVRGSEVSAPSPAHTLTITTSDTEALPPPDLLTPEDGATFDILPRRMTLTWSDVPSASRYLVEIEYCVGTTTNCIAYAPVMVDATRYEFNFIGAQPGRWRISSVSANGEIGQPSAWRTFTHLK